MLLNSSDRLLILNQSSHQLKCPCGKLFNFRNELRDGELICPNCNNRIRIPGSKTPAVKPARVAGSEKRLQWKYLGPGLLMTLGGSCHSNFCAHPDARRSPRSRHDCAACCWRCLVAHGARFDRQRSSGRLDRMGLNFNLLELQLVLVLLFQVTQIKQFIRAPS